MKTKKDHLNSYNELKRDFDKEQEKNRLLLKKLSIFMKNWSLIKNNFIFFL
jgi:hypothetical protein